MSRHYHKIAMSTNLKIIQTICSSIFILIVAECADFVADSYEINRVDLTPFNDAILFNDIAEIISDFDSNMYPPLPSNSESEENIEDLLSEYQHYLDKAHKQRKNYEEKSKSKNKIPLLRRDKYTKMKPFAENKYVDYFDAFPNTFKFSERPFNNQLDLFIPYQSDLKYYHTPDFSPVPRKSNREDKSKTVDEKKILNTSPILQTNYDPVKSPCICKDNQIPCNCDCKQCLVPWDMYANVDKKLKRTNSDNRFAPLPIPLLSDDNTMFEISGFFNRSPETSNNQLNIRIKVDIQLPKILDTILNKKNCSQESVSIPEIDGKNSKETKYYNSSPISKLNLPIPLEFFGLRKPMRLNKHDSSDLHKITIHKKKKTKLSNGGNKKHKKRIITFHNIKFEPQVLPLFKIDEKYNDSNIYQSIENNDFKPQVQTHYNKSQNINETSFNGNASTTIAPASANASEIKEINPKLPQSVYVNIENKTEVYNKTENSIETDFVKTGLNISTVLPPNLRNKRSVAAQQSSIWNENHETRPTLSNIKNEGNPIKNMKNNNKLLTADSELLYWPNNDNNYSSTHTRNITEIILESENNKVKLNMSQETIRKNRTLALEHAIFGNVDWNDVGTVAPVFMSFMGKYIRGILTFCSQIICHSMKCIDKICTHRVCPPEERYKQRGHCSGSDKTDSVATMEAIMDLPSNIAFEIVDILQNKMLGKIFGKVTLCISSKCISLVASKKKFLKSKCSVKELNPTGHCSNLKHSKVM